MKKIVAYVKPFELEKTVKAFIEEGIDNFAIEEVKEYFSLKEKVRYLPRIKIHLWVEGELVQKIQDILSQNQLPLSREDEQLFTLSIDEYIDIQQGSKMSY